MRSTHKNEGQPWWRDSVLLFSKLSGWIGMPVVLALFLGKWLDQKYGTEPWLLLATVGAAFTIASFGIVKEGKEAMEKIAKDEEIKKNKEKEENTE